MGLVKQTSVGGEGALKRYLLIIILIVLGSAAAVHDVVLRMENERVQNMSEHLLERVFIRGLRDYYGMLTDARTVMENGGSAETLKALTRRGKIEARRVKQ